MSTKRYRFWLALIMNEYREQVYIADWKVWSPKNLMEVITFWIAAFEKTSALLFIFYDNSDSPTMLSTVSRIDFTSRAPVGTPMFLYGLINLAYFNIISEVFCKSDVSKANDSLFGLKWNVFAILKQRKVQGLVPSLSGKGHFSPLIIFSLTVWYSILCWLEEINWLTSGRFLDLELMPTNKFHITYSNDSTV